MLKLENELIQQKIEQYKSFIKEILDPTTPKPANQQSGKKKVDEIKGQLDNYFGQLAARNLRGRTMTGLSSIQNETTQITDRIVIEQDQQNVDKPFVVTEEKRKHNIKIVSSLNLNPEPLISEISETPKPNQQANFSRLTNS